MDNQQVLPRGLRNNNPLNIRRSADTFQGELQYNPDPDFKLFRTADWGYRAAFCILRTYLLHKGLKTISEVINRWCPDATAGQYIKAVCQLTGFSATTILNFGDKEQMVTLVAAMSYVENGRKANIYDVRWGYYMSLNGGSRRQLAGKTQDPFL